MKHHVKVILIMFLESISHQKITRYDIFVDYEEYTTSSSGKTLQQIEVIQEIVLPEVSIS